MAMIFLSQLFLSGLALGGLPILIHLFARRRRKVVPWGAMQFLMGTPPRFRRTYLRLSELLLLLLRVLAVLALVLAFARPIIPLGFFKPHHAEALFIVDASLSTTRLLPDGTTAWNRELAAVNVELGRLAKEDTVRILIATDAPQWLTPAPLMLSPENRQALSALLKKIRPSLGGSSLPAAVGEALQYPAGSDRGMRRILLFSDATVQPWQVSDAEHWRKIRRAVREASLPTFLEASEEVQAPDPQTLRNISVDRLAPDRDTVAQGDEVTLTADVRNRSAKRSEAIGLAWKLDGKEVGRSQAPSLEPGATSTVEFSLSAGTAGSHILSCALVAPDDLPGDNESFAAVRTLDQLPLLIVDGARQKGSAEVKESGFFLAALGHLPGLSAEAKAAAIFQPQVIAMEDLGRADLKSYFAVVLANVEKMERPLVQKLASYVGGGGGLWLALGDKFDAEAFNAEFTSQGVGLSPLRFADPVGDLSAPGPGWRVLPPDSKHPATALLRDTTALDVMRARVQRYIAPLEPMPTNLTVLLALESQAPLVIAHEFGQGRVFLQTIPLNRSWSNLPILQAYVPLVREFVWHLAGGRLSRRNVPAGDTFVQFAGGGAERPFSMQLPDGEKEHGAAEQSVVRFSNTFLPGIYRLETSAQQPPEIFSVPRSAEESDLTPLSEKDKASLLLNGGVSFGHLGSTAEAFQNSVLAHQSLTEPLLWLALAFLVLEALMAWLMAHLRSRKRGAISIDLLHER